MSDIQSRETQGLWVVAARLREEHDEVARCERRLRGARRRRALLVLKLVTGGWTERKIVGLIRVESAHIHQWKVKAKREREAVTNVH